MTSTGHVSREFVALILLPLVGNAAEHVTAGEFSPYTPGPNLKRSSLRCDTDGLRTVSALSSFVTVVVSIKDKIDLSLSIAVGSSLQIALFVIPFLVLLAWCIGQPLTLKFDLFETICLFLTILIVNWAIQDGTFDFKFFSS